MCMYEKMINGGFVFLVLCRFEIMGDKLGLFNYLLFFFDKLLENYFCFICLIIMVCGFLLRDILSYYIKLVNLRKEFDINRVKFEKYMIIE